MPQFGTMRRLASIVLPLLLLIGGCSDTKNVMGGKKTPILYASVVSLSPGATELTAGIYGRKIVGRTASCNTPDDVKSAPIVMNGVKPDYEKIAKIHPDVVVYDKDLFAQSDIDKFKELNIPVFGFGANTVEGFIDEIFEFGRYTHEEALGSDYVEKINREVDTWRGQPLNPPVSTAVVIPGTGGEHYIAGTQSFIADVVKCCRGQAVGPDAKIFMPMNAEWMVKTDPEVIICAGPSDNFLNDARFKNLRAIKKKLVYSINQDILLRRGAALERLVRRLGQITGYARKVETNEN